MRSQDRFYLFRVLSVAIRLLGTFSGWGWVDAGYACSPPFRPKAPPSCWCGYSPHAAARIHALIPAWVPLLFVFLVLAQMGYDRYWAAAGEKDR